MAKLNWQIWKFKFSGSSGYTLHLGKKKTSSILKAHFPQMAELFKLK